MSARGESGRRSGVAYFLDAFPVLSETFIVREIVELKRMGFDVPIFALGDTRTKKRGNGVMHAESTELANDTFYFSDLVRQHSKVRLIGMHLMCFFRSPIQYIRLLILCYRCDQKTLRLFSRSVAVARSLADSDIGHLHAHFALNACTLAMLVSAWSRIPFSFTVHAHDIFIPGLAKMMEEKLRRASFIVSISEYNKAFLMTSYPDTEETKLKIVHCGIDVKKFSSRTIDDNKCLRILSVGRLHEQKGFEYLIRACEILRNEYQLDYRCEILGEGDERKPLEGLILAAGLEQRVGMPGAVDGQTVRDALEAADVFVLPCIAAKSGAMDGIPVALMEAMATGVPAISTRISGIPELIVPGTGLVVEPENERSLSDGILEFARWSESTRKDCGLKAREAVIQKFNLSTEVEKLSALFLGENAPRTGRPSLDNESTGS